MISKWSFSFGLVGHNENDQFLVILDGHFHSDFLVIMKMTQFYVIFGWSFFYDQQVITVMTVTL
jgi:hypothetical protein